MRFLPSLLFVLLCLSAITPGTARGAGHKVLFIGNSFTYYNDLPGIFGNITESGGFDAPTVNSSTGGGTWLAHHLDDTTTLGAATLGLIDEGGWDFVVLQEQSTGPATAAVEPGFYDYIAVGVFGLYDRIKTANPNAMIVLYETWAWQESRLQSETELHQERWGSDAATMQARISSTYHRLETELIDSGRTDVRVAHVGDAREVNRLTEDLDMFSDVSHPNPAGSYLAGLVIYSTIFEADPLDVTYNRVNATDSAYIRDIARYAARLPVPNPPRTPSATLELTSQTIDWDEPIFAQSVGTDGLATGYRVQRAENGGGPYTTVGTPSTNQFVDNDVVDDGLYYYVISATNASGESPLSEELVVSRSAPEAPPELAARAGHSRILLTWDTVDRGESYTLYRSTTSGSGYTALASGLTDCAYTDNTATADTTYDYTVTATDVSSNESEHSAEVTATLAPEPDFSTGPIAYWNFADAGATGGGLIPGNGDRADLDGDGAMDTDDFRIGSADLSGNGNHLTAWTSSWMKWSSDSTQGDFSMQSDNSYPAAGTDSAYNLQLTGIDLEAITPSEWTVEVIFKSSNLSNNRTLVGRDGRNVGGISHNGAALYFSTRGTDLALEYFDVEGGHHNLRVATGLSTGTWYTAAATSDGSTLRLYLDGAEIGTLDLTTTGTDTALGLGYGTWTVSRGMWADGHTDRFFGVIDAVAISGVALAPGTFVTETFGSNEMGFNFDMAAHGLPGAAFEDDANANGIANGLEYFLGRDPTKTGSQERILTFSEDRLSVRYPFNPSASGVTGVIKWTTDLASGEWFTDGVTYVPHTNPDEIEATFTSEAPDRIFIRLEVVQ